MKNAKAYYAACAKSPQKLIRSSLLNGSSVHVSRCDPLENLNAEHTDHGGQSRIGV